MLIDFKDSKTANTIEADICIIGAGAAGITMAHSLMSSRLSVCLLESGGLTYEQDTELLNEITINKSIKYNIEGDQSIEIELVDLDILAAQPITGQAGAHHWMKLISKPGNGCHTAAGLLIDRISNLIMKKRIHIVRLIPMVIILKHCLIQAINFLTMSRTN